MFSAPNSTSTMATSPDEFLYTTGRPLTTFHPFAILPANLRAHILLLTAPAPRTRYLELYAYTAPTYMPRIRYIPPLPPLFHVSRETRSFSIAYEGGSLAHFFAVEKEAKKFYVNFERDIVFLSSRFAPSGKSTETFRLRELSSLLVPVFLPRLRRVAVTYSGRDDYAAIGEVLLHYEGLETLYVAMGDWWSEGSVNTGLRQRRPVAGYVQWKIGMEVSVAEGEETEDEDESEEVFDGKMEGRRRKRVVECDLRLDE